MKAELELPAPLTLRLYRGTEVLFSSEKHWLHPLFDLEAFFPRSGQDPAGTRLVDRITGRAAAFLVVRLGIRDLDTRVLSRRAIPVLEAHGVRVRSGEETQTALRAFVAKWHDFAGSEKAEAQTFLNGLVDCYGLDRQAAGMLFEHFLPVAGFMDMFWPGRALVEMKAPSKTARFEDAQPQAERYLASIQRPERHLRRPSRRDRGIGERHLGGRAQRRRRLCAADRALERQGMARRTEPELRWSDARRDRGLLRRHLGSRRRRHCTGTVGTGRSRLTPEASASWTMSVPPQRPTPGRYAVANQDSHFPCAHTHVRPDPGWWRRHRPRSGSPGAMSCAQPVLSCTRCVPTARAVYKRPGQSTSAGYMS